MPIINVCAEHTTDAVMYDTWGHLYPEPGSKHDGEMLISIGQYGDEIVISSDFPKLNSNPQRYELERTIFQHLHGTGVYKINCTLWFFKRSNHIHECPGKIIKIKSKKLEI